MTTEERIDPGQLTHKSSTLQLSNLILTTESVFQTVQLPCAFGLELYLLHHGGINLLLERQTRNPGN